MQYLISNFRNCKIFSKSIVSHSIYSEATNLEWMLCECRGMGHTAFSMGWGGNNNNDDRSTLISKFLLESFGFFAEREHEVK